MAAPRTVLVVDDNAVNQRILVGILRGLGHAADVAGNGFQALEQLARRRYDAILMDLEMPTMDGFAAARIIRERESQAGRRVVIIAVTAHDVGEARARLTSAGINDLLSKPVSADGLAAALDHWLDAGPGAGAEATEAPPPLEILAERSVAPLRRLGILTSVLELFVESLGRHLAALRESTAQGDLPRALRAAHTLRGAAAQIGAQQLAAACSQVEEATRAALQGGAPERVAAALAALEVCVAPAREALDRELARGDAPE